jgi:hypothetical protein
VILTVQFFSTAIPVENRHFYSLKQRMRMPSFSLLFSLWLLENSKIANPLQGLAIFKVERAKGIEPSYGVWKTPVLPLNYARLRAVRFGAASPPDSPRAVNLTARACLVNRGRLKFAREFAAPHRRARH